jgi:lipopolysaccharide transport system permease protein
MTATTATAGEALASSAPRFDLRSERTSPLLLAKELWAARQLLVILARKEFHVRYRRASFGMLWALGLPLLQSLVMAVVFSHIVRVHNAPHYAVFILSGMTAWIFFVTALSAGSTAIVDNSDLSSKVYFPRLLLPLAQIGTALYGFVITVGILLVLSPILHVGLGLHTLWLIPASVLLIAVAMGFGLVDSALHVYFRDVRYIVSAAVIVWMYVTPIIYPPADVPHALRTVLDINPMTGVVDLFHTATVGALGASPVAVLVSIGWALGLLTLGIALHCRYDRVFTDLL